MSFQPKVLFEDNHLLVVNKPAGMLVQEDKTGDTSLEDWAKDYIQKKYNKPGEAFLGIVHRIDRPVSGLVLMARTSKALERMNNQFKERSIEKIYRVLVSHRPPADSDNLIHWVKKYTDKNLVKAYDETVKEGLLAELSYSLLGRISDDYLLEVKPVTGRPHQIRAQLAKIGCPIKGDVKYGGAKVKGKGRIYLHAWQLNFIHPVKKEPIQITADLPTDDLWNKYNQFK
ncbi:MAG: RluA family pseudouridine synthase [Cyclobacteriaceae bacterium]